MDRPVFIQEMKRLEVDLGDQPRWVMCASDGSMWKAHRPGVDWVGDTMDVMDRFVRVRSWPHGLYGPSVSTDIPFDDFLMPSGFSDR